MKGAVENLEQAAVQQQCRSLRLPAVADQCAPLADVATKQRQTYLRYLEALLAAELEERERNTIARRIKDARLPRMKTLDDFDFSKAPQVPALSALPSPQKKEAPVVQPQADKKGDEKMTEVRIKPPRKARAKKAEPEPAVVGGAESADDDADGGSGDGDGE